MTDRRTPDDGAVDDQVRESQDAPDEHAAKEHTKSLLAGARVAYAEEIREPAPLPPGFRSERRQVGDTTVHYVIGGSGPLVVLLHGFPNTWYAWREVMARLAPTMTVVAVDLRGLGDSDAGTLPNDVPTGAHDLALLLDEIDAGPALVAGQDWGGSTAFAFATAHPEAVRGLVVIEAMPRGVWTDATAATPWFVGFHQVPDLPEQMVRGRERVYLDWFYRAYSATPGVPDQQAVDEYLRTYSRPGVMASALERYRAVDREVEHNTRHLESTLPVPVLAVGGEHSFGGAVAENLRQAVPDVQAAMIEGCGHYVSEERPDELAGLLQRFSDEHP